MILPELVDMPCVLMPTATHHLTAADNHLSQFFNVTLFPTAACPRFVYGYPTYNPSASLTPTTLTNTLATAVAPPPPPQLPPALTMSPQQQYNSITTFQATLASSIASSQSDRLLQTSFHSNRIGYQGKNHIQNYRPGFIKQNFKPGMKRKSEDGDSDGSKHSLSDLMQPLFCKLCKVILNAPAQAKQHYEGKNHSRKLKMYMDGTEDQDENGQDSQVSSTTNGSSASTPPTPTCTDPIDPEIYCKMCGVSFNSIKQSQQHYQGKNHAKRVRATETEANGNGKKPFTKKFYGGQWYCHSCKVPCSNQSELESHCLTGRHLAHVQQMVHSASTALKGRWAAVNSSTHLGSTPRGIHTPTVHFNNRPSYTSAPPPSKRPRGDFSNYRLPSGKFYCSMCDQTVNNESQIAGHVESKKHKAAYAAMKTEQEVAELATK